MAIDHSVYGDLLAPIERLAGRVPDGIVTEDEQVLAYEMLSDASEEVRSHGRQWTSSDVPREVVNVVLRAAARGYMNPSLYREEDADSAGLKRDPIASKGVALTPEEIRRVKSAASRSGFSAIQASKPAHWKPRSLREADRTVYVPFDSPGERWFPWGTAPEGTYFQWELNRVF